MKAFGPQEAVDIFNRWMMPTPEEKCHPEKLYQDTEMLTTFLWITAKDNCPDEVAFRVYTVSNEIFKETKNFEKSPNIPGVFDRVKTQWEGIYEKDTLIKEIFDEFIIAVTSNVGLGAAREAKKEIDEQWNKFTSSHFILRALRFCHLI